MPALPAQSLPDGDGRTCTREPSYTREPSCTTLPLPSSYPGTVVETWHARDSLVPLFSFLQKEGWMSPLALGTVTTDALMGKTGRTEGPRSEMGRESLLGDTLTECRAQASCPAVLHPHTLPPQPHPCSGFALSSGDPITAIGSESPPGRGSGRAKPERFPDRRVGGGGGTRRGTICPACSCNLHPWRGQAPRIQDEKAGSQCQHLCLGMPGDSRRRSRPSMDAPGVGL